MSTLQDRMFPKAEKVSYRALLSMDLSRFLMKTFPTPDLRSDGSRCDHMILMGLPFTTSKFIVSRALSAETQTRCYEFLEIYSLVQQKLHIFFIFIKQKKSINE